MEELNLILCLLSVAQRLVLLCTQHLCTGCGRAYTSDHEVLTSPDYPNPYPHNAYCVYTITVPVGEVITFNITNVDIEAHANCVWDYLEVTATTQFVISTHFNLFYFQQ